MPDIFDSNAHRKELRTKIRAENAEKQQADEREATRVAENQELANYKGLPQEGETRDQLLDRIRKMREEAPQEPEPEVFRPPGLQKAFEAEQEMGRAMVAKAEAELERSREFQRRIEEEDRKRLGEMIPVYHPNIGQDEQYPATSATLGKRK